MVFALQVALPADPSAESRRLPYQWLPGVERHVKDVIRASLLGSGMSAREAHRVGLLIGAPGSGKTEALRHLGPMAERTCPELLQEFSTVTTLLMTYNGGNELVSGEEGGNSVSFRRMLALRLLHAALCRPLSVTLTRFAAAVKAACPSAFEALEPIDVIDLLRDWLGLQPDERWLVLLGVDEINKFVKVGFSLEPLTLLATELGVLGCAGSKLPATTVVPYAAGTTAEAVRYAFAGSNYRHELVNFTPLSRDDRGRILDALSEDAAPFLKGWRACRPLCVMIAFVGGHPRMFTSLVAVLRAAGEGHPSLALCDWGWTTILSDVEGCLTSWSLLTLLAKGGELTGSVLLQLLEDALLQTSVRRDAPVLKDSSHAPPLDPLSASVKYGDMEIMAGVVLEANPGAAELTRLYMPPVVMRHLMHQAGSIALDHRWGICLRDLLVNYTNVKVARRWQNWEVFTAAAMAVKLALSWRQARRKGGSSDGFLLGEFLGLGPDAIASGPPQLRWRVRPRREDGDVDVIQVNHRFPGITSLKDEDTLAPVDWAAGDVILNAPGAPLGDFFVVLDATRPDLSKQSLIVLGECRSGADAASFASLGQLQPSGAGWTLQAGASKEGDLPRKLKQLKKLAKKDHHGFLNGGWLMVVMHSHSHCKLTPAQVAHLGPAVVLDAAGMQAALGPVLYEVTAASHG